MKNIHILPTDKPSRLHLAYNKDYYLSIEPFVQLDTKNYKSFNIYITSDEEINQQTKPCLCINTIKNTWDDDLIYYQGSMPQYHYKGFKKIILTTDQNLIKDDVQGIDDEFLEWFVNNPSCEEVEISEGTKYEDEWIDNEDGGEIYQHQYCCYKIIIPKEEAKERAKNYMSLKGALEPNQIKCYCGHTTTCDCSPLEEPKQETLEEAAKNCLKENNLSTKGDFAEGYILGAIMGAEWQQEQILDFLYSEITERRDYSASKMCEKVVEFIEQF